MFFIHLAIILASVVVYFYINYKAKVQYTHAIEHTPYDVIIVPGFPYRDSTWNDIMKMRVLWSIHLFEQGQARHIIYSGSAVYSPYIESEIMKQYALAMGIPAASILTETKAEHSTENLYYAYQIARENNFKKIALATDPFQSFFLTFFAHDHHMNIDYLPIQFDMLPDSDMKKLHIDPSTALVPHFVPLPDRQSLYERLKGTLGDNIHLDSKE